VRKTSLYLEHSVDQALQRRAERDGVTKAEVIRRALAVAAEVTPPCALSAVGALDFEPVAVDDLDDELTRTGFGE